MGWTRVKWSEAGQVLELMEAPAQDRSAAAGLSPEAYFGALRAGGRRAEAADFLSQALPRLEGVAWAARTVRDARGEAKDGRAEERALRAALFFVQDPSDARRRAAFEAAQACRDAGPEAMAAYAAFFSGGSMAPADVAPTPAPKHVAGRFVAGAVKLATLRSDPAGGALDAALDRGDQLARDGLGSDA